MPGRKPGTPKTGGRAKGTPNKVTRELKDMILGALEEGGGQSWLVKQMTQNPAAFLSLIGRVLPLQVTGKDGGALEIRPVSPIFRAHDG